jgi:hypothetical protein
MDESGKKKGRAFLMAQLDTNKLVKFYDDVRHLVPCKPAKTEKLLMTNQTPYIVS